MYSCKVFFLRSCNCMFSKINVWLWCARCVWAPARATTACCRSACLPLWCVCWLETRPQPRRSWSNTRSRTSPPADTPLQITVSTLLKQHPLSHLTTSRHSSPDKSVRSWSSRHSSPDKPVCSWSTVTIHSALFIMNVSWTDALVSFFSVIVFKEIQTERVHYTYI